MTHDDIVNLAKLVKISVTDEECKELVPKMDSILGYIDQIQNVNIDEVNNQQDKINPVLREDIPNNDVSFYFMNNVPLYENGYVKVPRVLNTD